MSPSKAAPTAPRQLAQRLAQAGQAAFIGRERERALFREALSSRQPPVVVHVHGCGGIGKTALVREFARLAAEQGRPIIALDARHITPSRAGVLDALAEAAGRGATDPRHIPVPPDSVVVIDTYERLAALDDWLRDSVLPGLPAGVLIVLAGRERPAIAWQTDIAWAPVTRILELHNFAADESAAFLASRGVAEAARAGALAFTHGHPLALALVAELLQSRPHPSVFDPLESPDVVGRLLAMFLETVPAGMREALEITAIARVTTEGLLRDLLGDGPGRDAFAWLRAQTFVESSARGLHPHDLVREVVLADARWRDRDGLRRQARRVYAALHGYIGSAAGSERQRLQMDALYVTRTTPTNLSFFAWDRLDGVAAEPADASEHAWIVQLVRRHEGDASADLASRWTVDQPEAFHVFRDASGTAFGFLALLDIGDPTWAAAMPDPAIVAARRCAAMHGPVRAGEGVVHLRWWMHAEACQAVTAAINLTAMHVVSHCVTRPGLAWNFVTMHDPGFWAQHFEGVNFARVPEADFEVGGRRYGVFAHDWRLDPPADWLIGTRTPMPFGVRPAGERTAPPVLGEHEFRRAVGRALRDVRRPDVLAGNPLCQARLMQEAAGPEARAGLLHRLLHDATAALDADPRDRRLSQVIRHTFLEPLGTQELVAERLALPFSTYRHQLGRATDRVAGWLWQRESALRRR